MDSIDRVKRAIEFKGPDRVPFYHTNPLRSDIFHVMYLEPKDWRPQQDYHAYLPDYHLVPLYRLVRPNLVKKYPGRKKTSLFEYQDEFDCIWSKKGGLTIGTVTRHPMSDWSDLKKLKLPDPYDMTRFTFFSRLTQTIGRRKYKIGDLRNFIWERAHFLRGFTQFMMDLIEYPDEAMELLNRLKEWFIGLIDVYAELGYDAVFATDDWGTEQSLMISPQHWRQFFKPVYQEIFDFTHKKGLKFFLHSCGQNFDILEDLVEIGLDVLQKDDVNVIGLKKLGDALGGRLCFFCPADIQEVLPNGTRVEIREHVREMINRLGSHNGGIIGKIYPQPWDIGLKRKNVEIMIRAFREYGGKGK